MRPTKFGITPRIGALSRSPRTPAVLVLLLALAISGCQVPEPSRRGAEEGRTSGPIAALGSECRGTGTQARRDLAYREVAGVEQSLLSLDLYLPVRPDNCDPAPVVVYVHGGSFVTGDKAESIDDKVRLFNDEGWVFASVNYRLSPDPPESSGTERVMYPEPQQDIAAALGWLDDHAAEFGGDPDRFLMMGHSAGAFLVSLVSTDDSFVQAEGITLDDLTCTASLDTQNFDVAARIDGGGDQRLSYLNAFGTDPAVWEAASPIRQVAPDRGIGAFLLVTRGSDDRAEGNQDFADALATAGIAADVVSAEPYTHAEVNDAVGKPGDSVVTPPLMNFFRTCAGAG